MHKIILVDPWKCTGCRMCEVACSFYHEKECNPSRSRINVLKLKDDIFLPSLCQHCEEPLCIDLCFRKAITRDENGRVLINYDRCIGCRLCLLCPLGGISVDVKTGKVIKCDLCGGEPRCVKVCPTKAVEYVRADRGAILRKYLSFQKLATALLYEYRPRRR
jgi:Fe-S-cluster-containing hydrogenase component 2